MEIDERKWMEGESNESEANTWRKETRERNNTKERKSKNRKYCSTEKNNKGNREGWKLTRKIGIECRRTHAKRKQVRGITRKNERERESGIRCDGVVVAAAAV